MAIAPFDRLLLPRIRQAQRQRTYARHVIAEWEASLPGRLLPMLAALPLPIYSRSPRPDAAQAGTLGAALALSPRLRLVGGVGSGRSLAIQQLVLAWAHGTQTLPAVYPLILHLPTAVIQPDEALQSCIRAAGFDNAKLVVERGLASGQWCLILDDWDGLDNPNRAIWKEWLLDIAERYPALPAVITTDDDESLWPDFDTWAMAPITPALLEQWLRILLPGEEPTLLLGPLTNDERVRLVGEHLADLVVLAQTYANSGFPSNRGRLYATALDRILRPVAGGDLPRTRTALAALGYHWMTQPTAPTAPAALRPILEHLNGLILLEPNGRVQFKVPLFAMFCAALHVAANQTWAECDPATPLWKATIPIIAGLMTDPEALYVAVRGAGRPDAQRTLLLGACLREHHVPLPGWSTAILGSLAQLAKAEPGHAAEVWRLFDNMPNVVAATIAEQLMSGASGERWTIAFLRILPPLLAAPYLLDIVGDSRLLRSTRRVAALQLQSISENAVVQPLARLAERPLDNTGRILTTQLLATSGPVGRRYIADLIRAGRIMFPRPDDGTDARAIVTTAAALLADQSLDMAAHTAASVALNGCVNEITAPSLLSACTAAAAPLREAARRALLTGDHSLALRAFGRLVLGDDVHWAARYEALQTLMSLPSAGSSALLARLLKSDIPLAARIEAARALMGRDSESGERLAMVMRDEQAAPSLRAAIALLGTGTRSTAMTSILLKICCEPAPAPLRASVVRAMQTCPADEVLAILSGIVEHERDDLETLDAAIETLGAIGDEGGIWGLRTILLGPLTAQLHSGWQQLIAPSEIDTPPITWNINALPVYFQWRWGVALSAGNTSADPPTSLNELVAREVQGLRGQAAAALSAIGGTAARQVLREALLSNSINDGFGPAPVVAAELARFDAGLDLIETLNSSVAPAIRWVAAHALQNVNASFPTLRQALHGTEADLQSRSAMLLALGNDPQIIPMLETMIVDDHAPLHLRADAVRALGQMGLPHVEGLLLALLASVGHEPSLQIGALDILQPPLSLTTLTAVRQILRDPRPPVDVAAAALRCLVRAGDSESLALFLRYAQHDSPTLAVPAIDGLSLLHDGTATALLSRLAHTSGKSTRIRLHATGALLKIEGNLHLPLVRQLVETGSISTRLLALDILLDALPDPTTLIEYLEPSTPTALRLRLANALAAHGGPEALAELLHMLEEPTESLALRCLATETLCVAHYSAVLPLIETIARDEETLLPLRRRAISGLRHWRNEPTTLLALSALADDPTPYIRSWALQSLLS
ncbi:MAG: HEAT repeat domain-containing protein [Herpetosiphonaceae bacterium]|nr:HEAT repeat domain-containing protein [Herpetosiphonaceae bacterium]